MEVNKIQEKMIDLSNESSNHIQNLMSYIYLKDKNTEIHCENVSKYSVLLGKRLNLRKEELELIKIGGMLHDIGKLYIPKNILNKNGKLTDDEYKIIKTHSIIGEKLLPNEGYEEIKQMIRSHHERIDGKGYPDGLEFENIPYFARILSIADSFDAMTMQRSYNQIKTLQEALDELYRCSRKTITQNNELVQQLDSNLVEKFIDAIKNNENIMEEFRKKDFEIIKKRNQKQKN